MNLNMKLNKSVAIMNFRFGRAECGYVIANHILISVFQLNDNIVVVIFQPFGKL